MCIVCEIKADLSKSKATAEEASALLAKVEKLAHGLSDALDVAQEVAEANPGAFSDEQRDRMQGAADLLKGEELAGGLGALLLAALLGGVKVETVRVELRDGESPEEAVARVMAEREASQQPTKH
uniref:Uncharacterized protein n=1 Tax=Stenotrophomonas phage vB_SmaS_QH3 TaxID=3229738 RepID=A0AAU7YUF8_9CAUD